MRWELAPSATGTRLTLSHTVSGPEWLPKVAAGWHICLDVADRWLQGNPVGRIAAQDAMQFGWGTLNDSYTARFAAVLPSK